MMTSHTQKVLTRAAVTAISLAVFISNFSALTFIAAIRDSNVVDVLWLAERGSSVVDSFIPSSARAAETAIDTSVNTTILRHQKSGKHTVCTSDSVCYAFYIDSDSDIAYQKSTDGGATWGGTGTDIDAGTWLSLAVWYDQWTPGDTGSYVHIAYYSTADDIMYDRFDTSNDSSLATEVTVASAGAQGSLTANNDVAVSKGTDGDVYVATVDETAPTAPANFTHKCATGSDCTNAANWASAGANPWDGAGDDTDAIHALTMFPLPDDASHDAGDMMLVSLDIADGTVEYKVYDDSANSWSTNFTNLPQGATDSTTYTHALSGTVALDTGAVYVSYVHNAGTANTSEVRAAKYAGGSWSSLTDPWPDTTDGTSAITDASIGYDENTGDLFVVYSRGSSATANDVYYAVSTDDGSSWSADNLLSSGTDRNHRAISINNTSRFRLFAVWHDLTATTGNDLYGNTVKDLFIWRQESYRFFNNANGTDVGSALASQDTGATLVSSGAEFRLRLLVHATGTVPVSGENLKLQFAAQSGSCDTGFSGESYSDVTGATAIAFNDNASPGDGDNLTSNANDPSAGHTVVNQDYEEGNAFTNTVAAIPDGQDGLWDFSLVDNGAPSDTTYCFRILKDTGDAVYAYSVIPQITTGSAGSLTVDIVDSNGSPVGSPLVSFIAQVFAFVYQVTTGSLGSNDARIRVDNQTGTASWSLTIAATDGSTAVWANGSAFYDYNDPTAEGADGGDADNYGGQLTITPSAGTITPENGCSGTGVSLGSAGSFSEGSVNSITLASAGGSAETGCYWDVTGIGLSQTIPPEQAIGTYTIEFTLTAS